MKKAFLLILCILIPLLIGALGGIATASGVNDWYLTIQKPSFNPPNYLFGPVWSFLYLLMGVSLYMIIQKPKSKLKTNALLIFGLQLTLNFIWSFLFFKFQLLGLAFVEIILIWISILSMILLFRKLNKTAAYLQIPYLLWVSFASILNGAIWYLNS
ncbi:MAG: TspO/MBR family protein [Flavobacteriia bacterium]